MNERENETLPARLSVIQRTVNGQSVVVDADADAVVDVFKPFVCVCCL